MKIGAVGDVHFGSGVGKYGPERLADQESALVAAFNIFHEEGCNLVLIAGDTFDGPLVPPEQYVAFAKSLARIDYLPVVMVNGNGRHDLATRKPNALAVVEFSNAFVSCSPTVIRTAGVQVCTLPWAPVSEYVAKRNGGSRDAVNEEVAELLLTIARDLFDKRNDRTNGPTVLLGHWALAGTSLPSGLPVDLAHEPILDTDAFAEIGFDAIVFGHIHKPQVFADGAGFYVGSPLPLNHGEAGYEHGCWVWDSEDGPTFHPIKSRRFVTTDLGKFEYGGARFKWYGPAPKFDGEIVRVRYTAAEGVYIPVASMRQAYLDAGAWRVSVEPTIVRDTQARISVTDDTDDLDAFDAWLDAENIDDGDGQLRDLHRGYVEAIPE